MQDINNQKLGVPELVSDTVSGKIDLARSTLQVLEIMKAAASAEVAIHVVKNAMVMNGSMQSKIYATIFGLASEIERDFISLRTREGLARCKADGIVLGRPRGAAKKLSLDEHAKKIDEYLALGLNKRAIAKLLGASPNTLYEWLHRRRPETFASKKNIPTI